jgi:hypothetical protein
VALIDQADGVDLRTWEYAGPVEKAYETSRAPIAMIVGPTGGGKSTGSARRCLRAATWQHRSPRDGVRRARIVCICPTYRRAWDTVMPSYFKVFPASMGVFRGSRGDPADHIFDMELIVRGTREVCHVEVLFRAVMSDSDIEEFFRGLEATAFWLPEADTNTDLATILSLGSNRVGRYPEPDDRIDGEEPAYAGVFGDANAPVIGSAFHDRFYLRRMPNGDPAPGSDRLFNQPGAFSPNAENMKNLRKIRADYYSHMATLLDVYDRRRMLDSLPGYGRAGLAVHPNFDPDRHVAIQALEVDRFSPIYIGVDAGSNTLHPGAVFYQKGYSGQWRAMAEIHVAEGQMNNAAFADAINATLNRRFGDLVRHVGAMMCMDPAAASSNAMSEYTTAMSLQSLTEIEVMIAPSNKPADRRSALDKLLLGGLGPRTPMYAIDPQCVGLIAGLSGGFHYPRHGQNVSQIPAKNVFSHVCEAAEYAPLTVDGLAADEARFIRPGGEAANTCPTPIFDR